MNQSFETVRIDFAPEPRHLHVDDVVERCRPARLSPDVSREHLARDEVALVPQQVLEQLELTTGELERSSAPNDAPRHEVHLEIRDLQPNDIRRTAATEQRANAREQLRQRERLHQVIVRTQVQPRHSVVDSIARRENEHWRLDPALPQRLENLEAAPPGEHQVENDEVEPLRARAIEPVLAGCRNHHVVVLRLQRGRQHLRQLPLVFDDEHAHDPECYRPALIATLTFLSASGRRPLSARSKGSATNPESDALLIRPSSSRP